MKKVCTFVLAIFAVLAGTVQSGSAELNSLSLPAVGHHQLRILAPTLLEVTLVTTKEPDPAPLTQWNFVGENFVLNLPATTQFEVAINGQVVPVAQVGFKRRPLYAPLKKRDLRIENALYLKLNTAVPAGATVTVKNPSGQLWADATVKYQAQADAMRFNPAIHVNQVGYIPGQSKKAFVGYYLGSMGEMAIPATTFSLVNKASGAVVFNGTLVRRADVGYTYTPAPYQQVYEADFSAVDTAGEYVIQVPGLGVSFPFYIGKESAAAFARAYALGIYHQRCGCKNELPHTRFEHGICHAAPAEVPDMTYTAVNSVLAEVSADAKDNPLHTAPQLKDVASSLYPFINKNPIDVSRGHHDAGDYSKYTINSAGLIHHLVFAADAFPNAGKLDNLGLPESHDGKSDLLQEAKWEADFLAKMQDADGGFYFLVYPKTRRYEDNVLPDQGDTQVIFPKTTAVTAAAVAALAEIASSPTFKAQYPTEAAGYLAKAKAGWTFLMNAIAQHGKNGAYQKITHYGNEFMHDDELAWAAAALFAATGEAVYQQKLFEWYDPANSSTLRWGWWRLFEGYGNAARTYAFAARSGRLTAAQLNSTYLAECEAELLAGGDDIARFAKQTAYGTSFPDPSKAYRSAGWYFSLERAFELATAQQLKPSAVYQEALLSNVGYEAGANPVNMSYITGLGYKRWRDIVHQYAQNDHRVLPPSGIPLGNIQGGFAWLENYKQELGRLAYPPDGATTAPYPYYDRFGDSFNTTTEFVVVDQARGMAALAYLLAQTGDLTSASKNMTGTIVGLPASIPAGESITATLSASGLDLSKARVVWEALDQEPVIGQSFTFSAKNPGEQWVEAEAQLPDGRRVYAKAAFTSTFPLNGGANSYQSSPVQNSPDMMAVYHLDGNVSDATGKNSVLSLFGNATLNSDNLGWMTSRTGAALHFNDLGDKATVAIPASLLYTSGTTTEITVEAMVYVNAYKGFNRGRAQLVSLVKGWNASLEFMEDLYSGAHLKGGTQFDFMGAALAAAMPVQKWHHLALTIGASGYSARVNGALVASVASTELANWNGGTAALELGNFDGWVDEVVVRSRGGTGSQSPNQPPVASISKPVSGASFIAPAMVALEAWASDADGTIAKVEYFAGSAKLGEASVAPYYLSWGNVAAGSYAVTARATDNSGATSMSAPVQITVGAAVTNQAPIVQIITPTTGATFKAPARIALEAKASDSDGSISRVEFYSGSQKIGEATVAPFRMTWSKVGAGNYAITAVATDNKGAKTTSAAVSVRVGANQIPTVQITKPTTGATFVSPATIVLESACSDPDGSVAKVEYYIPQGKLGEVTVAPYRLSVLAGPGQHTISAVATDNNGARSATNSVTVLVTAPPPTAPGDLIATAISSSAIKLTWSDVATDETGYRIYRSVNNIEFLECGQTGANMSAWSDSALQANTLYYYAVRAFNGAGESQEAVAFARTLGVVPAAPTGVSATIQGTSIVLSWGAVIGADSYTVRRSTSSGGAYTVVASGLKTTAYSNEGLAAGTYYYVVTAQNSWGESASSTAVSGTVAGTSSVPGKFLGANATILGSWKGILGADGYQVFGDNLSVPSDTTVAAAGKSDWTWAYTTTDWRALQKPSGDSRIAACWYASSSFDVEVGTTAASGRKVSLYFLDWDRAGRSQKIEVLDPVTGTVLHTYTLSSFGEGIYLQYEIKGKVKFRISRSAGPNAVLSGIFVDSAG